MIENLLKDAFLNDAIRDNLEYIFLVNVNQTTLNASNELSALPSTWNPDLWNYIVSLNNQIFLPIAGAILAFGLTIELCNLINNKNSLHNIEPTEFLLLFLKLGIAFTVVKNVFPILLGVFDIGSNAVTKLASLTINSGISPADIDAFMANIENVGGGTCLMIVFMTTVIRLALWIFNVAITVLVTGWMLQIYLYCAAAAIPAAAIISREFDMSKNYFKNICALALQGFLMMFCFGAYSSIVKNIDISGDMDGALTQVVVYAVLLIFMLFKTSGIAKSIMNSH